jgi:hypothetical protein
MVPQEAAWKYDKLQLKVLCVPGTTVCQSHGRDTLQLPMQESLSLGTSRWLCVKQPFPEYGNKSHLNGSAGLYRCGGSG